MFEIYDNTREFNFNINIEFNTKTEITPRILEISDAFGLGINENKRFSIFKNFKLSFNKGDVIFITGDSGGGKSLLLKKLYENLIKEKKDCLFLNDLIPNPEDKDKPVIDKIGKTTEEAIKYLSLMGLNDAFIFLRRYKELSDGQKYRFKLAELLSEKPEFIFIDEFCANLDRTTAKVIAYNLQRVCRKNNITLIVATTHKDIIEDFNPSIIVDKKFMNEVNLKYIKYEKKPISFYDKVIIEEGTMDDYKILSKYHYKNTSANFPYKRIYVAKLNQELVGVAVYSPPFLQTKGRTIKFNNKYSRMTKEVVADINKYFIRRSRNIISPKFRGCGLGTKLGLESMKMQKDIKYIEAINIMGKYNPVNERMGMEKIEITEETDSAAIKLDKWLRDKKLKIDEIHNPIYWSNWLDSLSSGEQLELTRLTGKVLHHPKIGLSSKDGKRAEVVAQEKRYEKTSYDDVKDEIKSYIPKLYSGMTLYYIYENPDYIEEQKRTLDYYGIK